MRPRCMRLPRGIHGYGGLGSGIATVIDEGPTDQGCFFIEISIIQTAVSDVVVGDMSVIERIHRHGQLVAHMVFSVE